MRECYEETGIIAVPEALTSVTVSGLITHDSGDLTRHLDITFRCRSAGGHPGPGDGEFQDVRWHYADELPALPAYELRILAKALYGDGQPAYTFSGISQALRNSQHCEIDPSRIEDDNRSAWGLRHHECGGPSEPEA